MYFLVPFEECFMEFVLWLWLFFLVSYLVFFVFSFIFDVCSIQCLFACCKQIRWCSQIIFSSFFDVEWVVKFPVVHWYRKKGSLLGELTLRDFQKKTWFYFPKINDLICHIKQTIFCQQTILKNYWQDWPNSKFRLKICFFY